MAGREKSHGRITFTADWLGTPFVFGGGFDSLKKTIPLTMHTHRGFEITYLTRGEVTWETGAGVILTPRGGQAAVTLPGTPHRGKWNIIQPSALFWIVFEPDAAGAEKLTPFTAAELRAMSGLLAGAGDTVADADDEFKMCMRSFLSLLLTLRGNPSSQALIPDARSLMCRIFVSAVKIFSNKNNGGARKDFSEKILSFFRENIERSIGVGELADRFGLSVTALTETFKNETGLTPADCFRRMKCGKAAEMLVRGDKNVTETAFSLGFSSSQNFAHVFKTHTGMTPAEFKKNNSKFQKN
jgi:AraC-like DNA-binding protein